MEKINQREKVTNNQMSNMANIHQSFRAKNVRTIYFVEDDYLHKESLKKWFSHMSGSISNNDEIILCQQTTLIYIQNPKSHKLLGQNYHWRKINETLCTFLTSKKIIEKHWKKYVVCVRKSTHPLRNLCMIFMILSYVYPQFHL